MIECSDPERRTECGPNGEYGPVSKKGAEPGLEPRAGGGMEPLALAAERKNQDGVQEDRVMTICVSRAINTWTFFVWKIHQTDPCHSQPKCTPLCIERL